MAESESSNLSGNCAILAGIAYIIVGITYFTIPANQRPNAAPLNEFYASVAEAPGLLQIQYWSFAFAALMGLAVVIAANRFFREGNEDLINWVSVMALIGYGLMCTNFIRLVDIIPERAMFFVGAEPEMQKAMLAANPLPLDPTSILTFGFVGFWVLVINFVGKDREDFPGYLSILGMLVGVLHIFVALGNLLQMQVLISIAAGLGGIVLGPIWLFWFGVLLKKER